MPLHSSQVVLDFILYPVLNQTDWKPDLDKQVIVSRGGSINNGISGHAVLDVSQLQLCCKAMNQPE